MTGPSIGGVFLSGKRQPDPASTGPSGCSKLATGPDLAERPALIIGLGNPGGEYAVHRHNIGFRVVDELAKRHELVFQRVKWARARMARGQVGGRRVLLAKPQTFMNLSGRTAGRLSRHYEISPDCMLVVYDELDLPLGRLRLRPGGGAGGHKGMRSIIETLGTQEFPRLRVGIDRPPGSMDPADYVLQPFDEDQETQVAGVIGRAVAAIECWLVEGMGAAMDDFNRPMARTDPGELA